MLYQNQQVEVLGTRSTFGKSVTRIKVLTTGNIIEVLSSELQEEARRISLAEIIFKSIAARVRDEISKQNLLAPLESNIIPLPHQILALEKVMSGAYMRFLMADEVGMGKTIETGLVLKELKLRGIVKRTLVIVPVSAMQQWRSELKTHFNEDFHIYDSQYIGTMAKTFSRIDADNDINMWSQHNQIIVSMDALKPMESRQGWSQEKVDEYNRYRIQSVLDADFDLLVIDECHKVGGSTVQVGRFQMAETLSGAIPNVLLLSATPHRGKSDHFRRILGLLDSDAFSGEGMPSIAELEPYVVRTEKRQAIDYNGKPLFNQRTTSRIIAEYHPVNHVKQQALYDHVSQYVINGFNISQQTKNSSYGFVMVLFQRLISSSTQAIHDAMSNRLERLKAEKESLSKEEVAVKLAESGISEQLELNFEEALNTAIQNTKAAYDTELLILKDLVQEARLCVDTELDAKLEFLIDKLSALRNEENNPELKFLIFTEFTSTQAMLSRELSQRGGYVCETINGSMDFETRVNALRRFKDEAQILVSTDAAGESLNMQFAHVIINYDLPWNPMVLEQRIGRVDRIGQKHTVLALNLMIDNSIDARVYEVIETKLNQIMTELGIDKTADVLDSTLETDSVNRLFMTSLLDPSRFEGESEEWLAEIREKLRQFKSTEGNLPQSRSEDIRSDKVDSIRYSPLPEWLKSMTTSWLKSNDIPYIECPIGIQTQFPGTDEQWYTFDTKTSLENPIPEPLTLQHEHVKQILADAVPHISETPIPVLISDDPERPQGYFSLWNIKASNAFEQRETVHPVFITDDGDVFPAYAQTFWSEFQNHEISLSPADQVIDDGGQTFLELQTRSEELLLPTYDKLAESLSANAERARTNRKKAFDFQMRQAQRIGIENIKLHRINRYKTEFEQWMRNFDSASTVVPELACLLLVRVQHG
jgi:superfamily II DNA or RNA helicase